MLALAMAAALVAGVSGCARSDASAESGSGAAAHLRRDSVTVKVGDEVQVGEQIGQFGDSGGSSAPHLHFHVVLGLSAVASNGVPYVFDSFLFAGTANPNDLDRAIKGKGPLFNRTQTPVIHDHELPLDYTVVDFPSASR